MAKDTTSEVGQKRDRDSFRYWRTWLQFAVVTGAALALAACGSDSTATDVPQISDSGVIYTLDDVFDLGFKKVKTYSVEGLPGGRDAVFGFWRPPGQEDPVDYEIRVYSSHRDAVDLGKPLAAEVTGKDAILTVDETTWKEGARDRRFQPDAFSGVRSAGGLALLARYGDFAIYANLVMLCEGRDSAQSLERCAAMISALPTSGANIDTE